MRARVCDDEIGFSSRATSRTVAWILPPVSACIYTARDAAVGRCNGTPLGDTEIDHSAVRDDVLGRWLHVCLT